MSEEKRSTTHHGLITCNMTLAKRHVMDLDILDRCSHKPSFVSSDPVYIRVGLTPIATTSLYCMLSSSEISWHDKNLISHNVPNKLCLEAKTRHTSTGRRRRNRLNLDSKHADRCGKTPIRPIHRPHSSVQPSGHFDALLKNVLCSNCSRW